MKRSRSPLYEKVVTLACANFKTEWGNKQANLEKIKAMVVQAARQGVNIIAFPELALSGYDCDEGCAMHPKAAEPVPGPATEEMAALARQHDIYVILGMPEQDQDDPAVRYISAAVIGPEGILGTYRKIHLASAAGFTETKCFRGGDQLPVFETRYGLIGVQICRDFWVFPELTRILVLKGARIIINITASSTGPGMPAWLTRQTGARAAESWVYAASANLVGKELFRSYYGHSAITGMASPRNLRIYAEGGDQEEIVSASLNLAALDWWRQSWNWEKDFRADLVVRELSKLIGKDS